MEIKDLATSTKQVIRNINLHLLCGLELKEPFLTIHNRFEKMLTYKKVYYSKKHNVIVIGDELKSNILFIYGLDRNAGFFNKKAVEDYDELFSVYMWYVRMIKYHFRNMLEIECKGKLFGITYFDELGIFEELNYNSFKKVYEYGEKALPINIYDYI